MNLSTDLAKVCARESGEIEATRLALDNAKHYLRLLADAPGSEAMWAGQSTVVYNLEHQLAKLLDEVGK